MAATDFRLMSMYEYIVDGFWEEHGDPFSKRLPLIDRGPWRIAAIVTVYLIFVKIVGPRWMAKRPAFELTKTIRYYDWFHVIANGVCSAFALWMTRGEFLGSSLVDWS